MKRLATQAANQHDKLIKLKCTPYSFLELNFEGHKNVSQTIKRHQELSIRFSHQLERLRFAENILELSSSPRHGINALSILTALHVDTCEKLHQTQQILDRMKNADVCSFNERSKSQVTNGDKLSLIYEEIEARHACSIETLMEAVQASVIPYHLLSPFISTRISAQLLLLHHLHLWEHKGFEKSKAICEISATSLLRAAVTECTYSCEAHYDMSPPVEVNLDVDSFNNTKTENDDILFIHASSYVKYILQELLKNAMRASIEKLESSLGSDQSEIDEENLEKVTVVLRLLQPTTTNPHTPRIAVEIIDKGNGIEPSVLKASLKKMGQFIDVDEKEEVSTSRESYQEEKKLWSRLDDQVSYMPTRSPLHGIGIGLAMSQAYATYLGGSLDIQSSIQGTKATLVLPRLLQPPSDAFEHIPVCL